MQHLTLGLVEIHEVLMAHFPSFAQIPLDDVSSFCCVTCTAQLCAVCKLAEGTLDLIVYVIERAKDVKGT